MWNIAYRQPDLQADNIQFEKEKMFVSVHQI